MFFFLPSNNNEQSKKKTKLKTTKTSIIPSHTHTHTDKQQQTQSSTISIHWWYNNHRIYVYFPFLNCLPCDLAQNTRITWKKKYKNKNKPRTILQSSLWHVRVRIIQFSFLLFVVTIIIVVIPLFLNCYSMENKN